MAKNNTHLLSLSFCGSGIQCSLAGSSASGPPSELKSKCEPELRSHLRSDWGRTCFQAPLVVVVRMPVLTGCCTGSLSSFLVHGWRPLSVPTRQLASSKSARERESPGRWGSQSFVTASGNGHPITLPSSAH